MYCERLEKKLINPKPKIKIRKISQSISHVDANNSIGFIAGDIGIKTAIKSAQKTGFGLVGIKNSGHYGLSSFYAEQAVKKKLMVWCFTNAPPAIAPYGSRKALFGTNPICFGTPTGNKVPFILDMSTSMINRGKIRRAAKLGLKIPKGVALDKFGRPTTDPKKAIEGVQLPIAGFKGSGLAWMIDIISGVLTGANHGGKVKDPFDDFSGPQNIGHLFIVIKPSIFIGNNYLAQIKKNIRIIKKLPKIKKGNQILYPGEKKYLNFSKNLKKSIIIPKNILEDLKKLNA
jgi:LDH2 family malate/lactate/ureidoglycolate dehydrogenase